MSEAPQPPGARQLVDLELKILAVQRSKVGKWWNYHQVVSPFSRLWLAMDGQASVTHHERRRQLLPGTLHLVPAYTAHDCHSPTWFDHYHLHFTSRLATGIDLFSLLDCEFELPATPQALECFQRLEALYPDRKLPCYDPSEKVYQQFSARQEQASYEMAATDWLEAQGWLRLLLAPFLRSARAHEGMHAQASRRFLAVQEYIQAHMAEPIALRDLAQVAGLNATYFSDRFHQLVGVRPLEYLARRRIERAQYLLLTTPIPVKVVASQVGLPDPAHFSRVFAQHCHLSPTAYRAAHLRPAIDDANL